MITMIELMKAKILVVDDELPIVKLLERVLQNAGHTCSKALSVQEAKERMQENCFDLLITDLNLAGGSGLDLLKYSSEHYPVTGRILMTGFNDMEIANQVLATGVYGYLLKPLGKELVLITVQNALRHKSLENHMEACLEEAQKKLIDKKNTLQTILNNMDVGVAVLDRELRLLEHNKALSLMFPQLKEDKYTYCYEYFSDCSKKNVCTDCSLQKAFDSKEPVYSERVVKTAEGPREFKISVLPIVEKSGEVYKGLVLYSDVTEFMESHRIASESGKMAAVGQLAAGIAHEINTPVQFLGDNINFLHDSFEDIKRLLSVNQEVQNMDYAEKQVAMELCKKIHTEAEDVDLEYLAEEIPNAICQSQDGVKRIAEIVKAMKDFSHPDGQDKTNADINELIKSTITVCRNEWKYVAEMKMNLADDLPFVKCLPSEISQVVLILVVNGAHAIEEKLNNETHSMGQLHVTTKSLDSEHIQISIRDTGAGIPEEVQPKIFQAFFTTKKRGKGTGQGLAMANSIISDNHHGELTFSSEPGKGTEFFITLPLDQL